MKTLKFREPLPEMILRGDKTKTWRINDKRGISKGDELSLCYNNAVEFAKAKAVHVTEKTFAQLTEEDFIGHEHYNSSEEMYRTYSGYYGFKVQPQTNVKIIEFRLKE